MEVVVVVNYVLPPHKIPPHVANTIQSNNYLATAIMAFDPTIGYWQWSKFLRLTTVGGSDGTNKVHIWRAYYTLIH